MFVENSDVIAKHYSKTCQITSMKKETLNLYNIFVLCWRIFLVKFLIRNSKLPEKVLQFL